MSGLRVDVRVDTNAIELQLRAFGTAITDRAIVRALNRAAVTVRAESAKAVRADGVPVSAAEARKAFFILRASRGSLEAIVRASGRRRIPLTEIGERVRQASAGVSVRVPGQGTVTIPHAFIAPRRAGARDAVFLRAPDYRAQLLGSAYAYRAKRVARRGNDAPIAEIMAPGVPAVFARAGIQRAMQRVARERFAVVLRQELAALRAGVRTTRRG